MADHATSAEAPVLHYARPSMRDGLGPWFVRPSRWSWLILALALAAAVYLRLHPRPWELTGVVALPASSGLEKCNFTRAGVVLRQPASDPVATLYDADSGAMRRTFPRVGAKSGFCMVRFLGGDKLLVLPEDGSLGQVLDLATGQRLRSLEMPADGISSISPDGRYFVVAVDGDPPESRLGVYEWTPDDPGRIGLRKTLNGHDSVSFSSDSRRMAVRRVRPQSFEFLELPGVHSTSGGSGTIYLFNRWAELGETVLVVDESFWTSMGTSKMRIVSTKTGKDVGKFVTPVADFEPLDLEGLAVLGVIRAPFSTLGIPNYRAPSSPAGPVEIVLADGKMGVASRPIPGPRPASVVAGFIRNSRRFWVCTWNPVCTAVFDRGTLKPLAIVANEQFMAVSDDGQRIATASNAPVRELHLWKLVGRESILGVYGMPQCWALLALGILSAASLYRDVRRQAVNAHCGVIRLIPPALLAVGTIAAMIVIVDACIGETVLRPVNLLAMCLPAAIGLRMRGRIWLWIAIALLAATLAGVVLELWSARPNLFVGFASLRVGDRDYWPLRSVLTSLSMLWGIIALTAVVVLWREIVRPSRQHL